MFWIHVLLNVWFVLKSKCLEFLGEKKKKKAVLVFTISSSQRDAETDNITDDGDWGYEDGD